MPLAGGVLMTIATSSSSSSSRILRLRSRGVLLALLSSLSLVAISVLDTLRNPSMLDCPGICGSLGAVVVFGVVVDDERMLMMLIRC